MLRFWKVNTDASVPCKFLFDVGTVFVQISSISTASVTRSDAPLVTKIFSVGTVFDQKSSISAASVTRSYAPLVTKIHSKYLPE